MLSAAIRRLYAHSPVWPNGTGDHPCRSQPHFGHDDLSSSTRNRHDKPFTSPTRERSTTARITDVPPFHVSLKISGGTLGRR